MRRGKVSERERNLESNNAVIILRRCIFVLLVRSVRSAEKRERVGSGDGKGEKRGMRERETNEESK